MFPCAYDSIVLVFASSLMLVGLVLLPIERSGRKPSRREEGELVVASSLCKIAFSCCQFVAVG